MSDVVPFGKYRGRPVGDMLADANYMDWLGAQPWFRERFGHLLSAHDKSEAEATPIHNRLQALFLDGAYSLAFMRVAAPHLGEAAIKLATRDVMEERGVLAAEIERTSEFVGRGLVFSTWRDPEDDRDAFKKKEALLDELERQLLSFDALPSPELSCKVAFEAPQDVVVPIYASRPSLKGAVQYQRQPDRVMRIEIKPAVGDDYPVVLRQMARNASDFLFTGSYEGVGATQQQFCAIFEASGRRVVFKGDIDHEAGRSA